MKLKELLGECLGTFILVLIGCGSVAAEVSHGTFGSLMNIAIMWGLGVTLAIYVANVFGSSHLNPAVSVAMCFSKDLPWKKLPTFILSQFVGALLAGLAVYLIFAQGILDFEWSKGISRGAPNSYQSAVMFGEFFPNPGFDLKVTHLQAILWEGFGTFLLVMAIFRLVANAHLFKSFVPVLIGLTVTLIILLVAPYTQAGLNPARDFGPRVVAYMNGWKSAAFPSIKYSFFTVYIMAPILGGILAHYVNRAWIRLLSNN